MYKVILSTMLLMLAAPAAFTAEQSGSRLLTASKVQGGLVVHLGCGNGRLTAGLRADDRYVVHGLDTDPANVQIAREYLAQRGVYGSVSIELLEGTRLPYSDNLVNLLVVDDVDCVSEQEWMRVLCPLGVAMVREAEGGSSRGWKKVVKPWPADIDEWTHFLHDASGNAVAHDQRVATPRYLQWSAGPKRTRDHDALSSFTTMTSSNGRIFYILDEGPTSQIHRQAHWSLIARDAFNGIPLWKRRIDSWVTHLYNFRAGPAQMTRRLVSIGDRVYVTLGYDAPVSVLDAADGQTLFELKDSAKTEELIVEGDVVLTVGGEPRIFDKEAPKIDGYWETVGLEDPHIQKSITAYRASTGETLWRRAEPSMEQLAPLSLIAGNGKVYYLDAEHLHCLEMATGQPQWQADYSAGGPFLRNYAPTVVLHGGVIVCLSLDKMTAFSASDGRQLWSKDQGYQGFASPGDVFVVNGLVWTFPATAGVKYESKDRVLGDGGSQFLGLDLLTGETKRSFAKTEVWPGGHHHRCYRNKATDNFAVCGRRGLEFIDLTGGDQHTINWWVRGICQYGVMPCNGMVYAPPDPCRCFSPIKLDGLLALTADNSLDGQPVPARPALYRGPVYKMPIKAAPASTDEWPTYRHDAARSGSTQMEIPAELKTAWKAELGTTPSGLVVACGRVYVSAVQQQTLYCLDADTGKAIWTFQAGGVIDSPPTIADGLAIFGCRDGRVYALRAADGQLAWSFRAGPYDRRIVGDGRLESAWPINGSVLVQDGVVYFSAGRSSFLDGGIRLYGVGLTDGQKRFESVVNSAPAHNNHNGALPDILVSNGEQIWMRQCGFDLELNPLQGGRGSSFSSPTGFLENQWGHRLTWQMDGASGNLLVFNDQIVCGAESRYTGWKKNKANWPPTHTGHLHQKYSRYQPEWFPIGNRLFAKPNRKAKIQRRESAAEANADRWMIDSPNQFRSLLLAGNILFAAGWPDAVTVLGLARAGADEQELRENKLWAISTEDGSTLAEYPLAASPVFDGQAAAYGRLFVALENGQICCLGQERQDR